ncbi:prion-like-(Q/N-rich) domain-bearing protein 25 [Dreissena polymorpha]|uniref:prion-like-(Q/N-rich) domain-bearing protein 25 n=1 Tax=Dreissena polymorpha TaxID=45954 RepID=UPI002263E797|nr:prion-like-(Q/N-rich) domain-bearing protein 25 [Dreissena polymorpha]
MDGHRAIGAWLLLFVMWTGRTDGFCKDDNDCFDLHSPRCYNDSIRSYCKNYDSCQQDADCGFPLITCTHGNCQPKKCLTDEDCHGDNSACFYGDCYCKSGYRKMDESCVSVIGLQCRQYNVDLDCNPTLFELTMKLLFEVPISNGSMQYNSTDYVCDQNSITCQCDTDVLKGINGVCNSYLGSECKSSLECGRKSNMSCIEGACACSAGFVRRESKCIWVMDAGCSSNEDCFYEGFECTTTDIGSYCRCPTGHAVKSPNNATCVEVYGSSCADIHMCGNTESFFYRRSYFEIQYKYNDTYANKAFHCDLDNVCSCAPGFRWNQQIKNCEHSKCRQK